MLPDLIFETSTCPPARSVIYAPSRFAMSISEAGMLASSVTLLASFCAHLIQRTKVVELVFIELNFFNARHSRADIICFELHHSAGLAPIFALSIICALSHFTHMTSEHLFEMITCFRDLCISHWLLRLANSVSLADSGAFSVTCCASLSAILSQRTIEAELLFIEL